MLTPGNFQFLATCFLIKATRFIIGNRCFPSDSHLADEQPVKPCGGYIGDRSDQKQVDDLDNSQCHDLGGFGREITRAHKLCSGGHDACDAHDDGPGREDNASDSGTDQKIATYCKKTRHFIPPVNVNLDF